MWTRAPRQLTCMNNDVTGSESLPRIALGADSVRVAVYNAKLFVTGASGSEVLNLRTRMRHWMNGMTRAVRLL